MTRCYLKCVKILQALLWKKIIDLLIKNNAGAEHFNILPLIYFHSLIYCMSYFRRLFWPMLLIRSSLPFPLFVYYAFFVVIPCWIYFKSLSSQRVIIETAKVTLHSQKAHIWFYSMLNQMAYQRICFKLLQYSFHL